MQSDKPMSPQVAYPRRRPIGTQANERNGVRLRGVGRGAIVRAARFRNGRLVGMILAIELMLEPTLAQRSLPLAQRTWDSRRRGKCCGLGGGVRRPFRQLAPRQR